MADGGTPLVRANTWFAIDGAITIVAADDPVELARRRVCVAKRARDEDALVPREEADACGWSSAVPERSLSLRRRRGPASSSSRGSTIVVVEEEHGCSREEAALDVAGAEGEAEEAWVDAGGEEYYYLAVL